MRIPIGAHWCQRAFPAAKEFGLDFCFLNADGFSNDERSREINDTDSFLRSPMPYILVFHLSSEARLFNTEGAWDRYVESTYNELARLDLLNLCRGIQIDDEWYTRLASQAGNQDVFPPALWPMASVIPASPELPFWAARYIENRADTIRTTFGSHVGQGVGMAETGAVDIPVEGLDWLGCNFYLYSNPVVDSMSTLYALYAAAMTKGLPLMAVFETGHDKANRLLSLYEMAIAYAPVLEMFRPHLWAVALFTFNHPSSYAPQDHPQGGKGILQLPADYQSAIRQFVQDHSVQAGG